MTQRGRDQSERPICVLVANLSGVILELIVRLIQEQSDMRLVDIAHSHLEILAGIDEEVNLLLLGVKKLHPLPAICSHLLSENPHLKIIVLTANGEHAKIYWLGLYQQQMHTVSANTLLDAIRYVYEIPQFDE